SGRSRTARSRWGIAVSKSFLAKVASVNSKITGMLLGWALAKFNLISAFVTGSRIRSSVEFRIGRPSRLSTSYACPLGTQLCHIGLTRIVARRQCEESEQSGDPYEGLPQIVSLSG